MYLPFNLNDTLATGWVPEPHTRGTWSILSSCLVTISLCVWAAVHLNVPRYGESRWRPWFRRFYWLLIGLFAPEIVAYTAWRQRTFALVLTRDMRQKLNETPYIRTYARILSFISTYSQRLLESLPSFPRMKTLMRKFHFMRRAQPESKEDDQILKRMSELRRRQAWSKGHRPRKYEWTHVHSHYAQMGGFAFDLTRYAHHFAPGPRVSQRIKDEETAAHGFYTRNPVTPSVPGSETAGPLLAERSDTIADTRGQERPAISVQTTNPRAHIDNSPVSSPPSSAPANDDLDAPQIPKPRFLPSVSKYLKALLADMHFAQRNDSANVSSVHETVDSHFERLTITEPGLILLAEYQPNAIPDLSIEQIEDKSKANGLTKALVCLQALWFCVQCITRMSFGLSISLLELNTFGHSVCALLIAFLWWHKPLDVSEPSLISVIGTEMEELYAFMCMASRLEGQEKFNLFRFSPSDFPFRCPEPFSFAKVPPTDLAPIADRYCELSKSILNIKEPMGQEEDRGREAGVSQAVRHEGHHTSEVDSRLRSNKPLEKDYMGGENAKPQESRVSGEYWRLESDARVGGHTGGENSGVGNQEVEQSARPKLNPQEETGEHNAGWEAQSITTEYNRDFAKSSINNHAPQPLLYGFFKIWEGEMLYGFKLHMRKRLAPENFGIKHQDRPYLLLRPRDVTRWRLASQAIERHGWYTLNNYSERFVKLPMFAEDWLECDLVSLRKSNHAPGFIVLGIKSKDWLLYFGMTAACAIYGGMHLLAWNAHFPSRTESVLWRLSSIAVAGYGPVYLPRMLYMSLQILLAKQRRHRDQRIAWHWWRDKSVDNGRWYKIVDETAAWIYLIWLGAYIGGYFPLYFLSRGYLVVECFTNLFHLPDSVLQTPNWSQYFPHIS
ncbi:uncharacterized protein BDR25DRAFT_295994 [Lindgomyces ingoldianus]|uniref:Uncharacterized protein n=1 Tax=Lindgomyces ingoldianus TaxID=673940 RepID=A0ACB6QCU0_9PLEO|nr:uncharacterized protein BDR25DRAFT_295994 [Lindgomyces ingoldianus]KAF2464834.1 hypothetical protein BDR25DRAFT_295994 [Lindgomyces ingoldianus]